MENKKIKVLGFGSGAMHTVNYLSEQKPENVELICINSDKAVLERAKTKALLIGKDYSNGLGAGGNPERGKRAAEVSEEEIKNEIKDADLLVLIACLGGGTGTGASVSVAQMAKELNIKTYAFLTYPFSFEGKKRMNHAICGYTELVPLVEETFVTHNDDLLPHFDRSTSVSDAFKIIDKIITEEFLRIYRREMRKSD